MPAQLRSVLTGWCLAVLILVSLPAGASGVDVAKEVPFAAQRAQIERELATGDRYVEIEPEQLQRVRTLLDDMGRLLGEGTSASLSPEHKSRLFNMQEEANAILTAAEQDSRLVCRRERPVGTNRPVSICYTVAERREMREESRKMMRTYFSAQPEEPLVR